MIKINNNYISDKKTILILKDSYVDCFGPLFSLGVAETTLIDLRHFTGSIRTFILKHKPDIVITMLCGGNYRLDENYESHMNIIDYR